MNLDFPLQNNSFPKNVSETTLNVNSSRQKSINIKIPQYLQHLKMNLQILLTIQKDQYQIFIEEFEQLNLNSDYDIDQINSYEYENQNQNIYININNNSNSNSNSKNTSKNGSIKSEILEYSKYKIILIKNQLIKQKYQLLLQAYLNQNVHYFTIKCRILLNNKQLKLSYRSSQYLFLLSLCEHISKSIHPLQLMINPFDHSIYFQMKSLLNNTSLKILKKNVDYYQCFYCEIILYVIKNVQKYVDVMLYVAGQIQIQDVKNNKLLWKHYGMENVLYTLDKISQLEKSLFYLSYTSKIQYEEYNKNIKMNSYQKFNHINLKSSMKQKNNNKIKHMNNINTKKYIPPQISYSNINANKSSLNNLYSSMLLNSQLEYHNQQNSIHYSQFYNNQQIKQQILSNTFQYYLDQVEDVIKMYKKNKRNVYENINFNVNLYQTQNQKKKIEKNKNRKKSMKRSKSNKRDNSNASGKSNNKVEQIQIQKQKNNKNNNMQNSNSNRPVKQTLQTPPRLPTYNISSINKPKSSQYLCVQQQNNSPQPQPKLILNIIQILDNQDVLQQYQDILLTKSHQNYKKSFKFMQKQEDEENILDNDFIDHQNKQQNKKKLINKKRIYYQWNKIS